MFLKMSGGINDATLNRHYQLQSTPMERVGYIMTIFPRFKVLKPLATRGGITRFSVVWLCSPRALLAVTGWMAKLLRDDGVSLRCGGGHVSCCGPAG